MGASPSDGTLRLGGELVVIGTVDAPTRADYAPLSDPCDCSGDNYFDVATAVADAAVLNDNAAVDLDSTLMTVGEQEVYLPLAVTTSRAGTRWAAFGSSPRGNVALFVDGSINTVGEGQLSVLSGGSLDLYVGDALRTVGRVSVDGDDPGAFRLFVGGDELVSVGEQAFVGHIYAPLAAIGLVGYTEVHGSVFGRRLDGVGELTIVYAGGATTPEETCEDVPPDIR